MRKLSFRVVDDSRKPAQRNDLDPATGVLLAVALSIPMWWGLAAVAAWAGWLRP